MKENVLTSTFVIGLKTTVNDIILEEVRNEEKLPETFNFENIKRLFEGKWKSAFGSPLPLIQPPNYHLLYKHKNDLKELFDFENPSRAFNFKTDIELAFKCDSFCQSDDIQDCHNSVIRNPIKWWNKDNGCGLEINLDREEKTEMSSKLSSQTIEDVKSPDLVVEDTFGRILFQGKYPLLVQVVDFLY